MTATKANRAVLYLILGFVAANLAIAIRMNATTVFRAAMVEDMRMASDRLARMEANQHVYMLNQKVAMKKLGIAAIEPATNP